MLHAKHRAIREAWLNDFNTLPPDHLWRSDPNAFDEDDGEDDTFQGVPRLDEAAADAAEEAEAEARLRQLRIESGDYPSLDDLEGLSAERGRPVTREEALRWAGMDAAASSGTDGYGGDDDDDGDSSDDEGRGGGAAAAELLDESEVLSADAVARLGADA